MSVSQACSSLVWAARPHRPNCPLCASSKSLQVFALRSPQGSPFPSLSSTRIGRRGVPCRGTKWADRLSRDLYAVENGVDDEVESMQRAEDKNGLRGNKINGALTSSFPPKTERTIALPLDYYQVLGADTHFLADAIIRAYEARVNNPPREGFSQDALLSRQEILKGACETLADPELRGEYNESLVEDEAGTVMVDVPLSKVPGALCLLQEVGEMEIVLQVGQSLLRERLAKSFQRDVVLAMALSYVELSREAMAEPSPAIVRSCELLERSLKLLHEEGGSSLAPALQEQIDETLQQINPRCMLELLALPLDKEHEGKREEGLQGIRSILWAVGEGGAFAPIPGFTRQEYMKEAFARMTADEQVALFTATPSNIPAESSEVYAVAVAHVAEGFVAKKPRLIQEADTLFLQLQQTNASSDLSGDFRPAYQQLDFALERGMCALLLGELEDCRAWLGLDDKNSPYRDPAIADFVFTNSLGSEEGDYLPGLCKLLESWLREVVFPSFREKGELQMKLRDYYDDPGVLSYLERLEKGESPLAAAAAIVQLGAGAGAALDSMKASALETLQKVFPLGKTRGSSKVKDYKVGENVVTSELSYDEQDKEDPYHSHQVTASADGSSVKMPGSSLNDTKVYGGNWGDSKALEGREGIKQQGLSPVKIACAGVLVSALAFSCWRIFSVRHGSMKAQSGIATPIVNMGSPGSFSKVGQDTVPKMDARLAEQLVQKWQAAKAQALGADHAVGKLSEVLDGRMLKSWSDRAADVSKNGWFWEYKLISLSIDSVTISTDGRRAIVEATLQEAASLYDQKKLEVTDSYHSTYTTRYELAAIDSSWKITSGAVLRS